MEVHMNILTKERFLDISHFKRPGDLCLLGTHINAFWRETFGKWRTQGGPEFFADPPGKFSMSRVYGFFEFEDTRWLREIDSGQLFGMRYIEMMGRQVIDFSNLLNPKFEIRQIDEDGKTVTLRMSSGQIIKLLKNRSGMPMFIDWPIKDRKSWEELKRRLDPNTPERYPAAWETYVEEINQLEGPIVLEVGGFFGFLREWVGTEKVLYLFYDDPNLVEEIMDTILFLEMEIVKKVSKNISFQMAAYWEDMAYNAGPLISPAMFQKFMKPRYQKLNELLHQVGVDIIYVDCDGNLDLLIPLWLECGINFVWPLEVAAGNNAVALRKKYGKDLILAGNIDKRALIKGPEAIREEVMSKVPFLLEKGGYFPSVDHSVPPDVTFENFCYFINLLREIGGLGKLKF
jgi:uroporphyrinogen-III decarboxylase